MGSRRGIGVRVKEGVWALPRVFGFLIAEFREFLMGWFWGAANQVLLLLPTSLPVLVVTSDRKFEI